jgi:hypothetical protein
MNLKATAWLSITDSWECLPNINDPRDSRVLSRRHSERICAERTSNPRQSDIRHHSGFDGWLKGRKTSQVPVNLIV